MVGGMEEPGLLGGGPGSREGWGQGAGRYHSTPGEEFGGWKESGREI